MSTSTTHESGWSSDGREPSGKAAVMELLSQRYRIPLLRFFEKRVGPSGLADVEDLVQEVFLRLSISKEIQPGERLEGYIFQAAANLLRDRHRRLNARIAQSHESYDELTHGSAVSAVSPDRILYGVQLIAQLVEALHELPERSRAVFALYHFENLSHAEIARRLGMAVSTIEKHMGRVNAHLLKRIDRST